MSSFRAIIIPLRYWVKSCTHFLPFKIPGIHFFYTLFTWKSVWINSGITGISHVLSWISGGKVTLCHPASKLHACVMKSISTYPQRILPTCYLISWGRFVTLLRRTANRNIRAFLSIKSNSGTKIELMCYNPPEGDIVRSISKPKASELYCGEAITSEHRG